MKKAAHVDYDWNESEDLRRIEEGIADINQRISNFQQEQASESEEENENEGGIKWPSFQ